VRILIVDDERSIRLSLSEMMKDADYEVEVAEDATMALSMLKEETYDIVLSDIIMPKITGVSLLHSIKETWPDIEVILMTGEPTVESASAAVRAGACDYLTKPVRKLDLLIATGNASQLKLLRDRSKLLEEENREYQENLEHLIEERTTELRESEKIFRNLFENSALGIFRSTPEGTYEFVNNTFARILGFDSPKKMLSQVNDISKLYKQPEDRERIVKEFAEKGFVKDFIIQANHPEKNIIWISVNAKQYKDPDGFIYFEGTVQDVTGRKQAEEALLQSKESLEQAQLSAKLGSWEMDAVTKKLVWSNQMYQILEINTDEEPSFELYYSRIHPDDLAYVQEVGARVYADNEAAKAEYRLLMPSGSIKILSTEGYRILEEGEVVRLTGIVQDITESKQAEDALSKSRDLLKLVIENAPMRVFWKDSDLRYLGCNTAFAQDAGMSHPEDLLGKDDFQMGWRDQAELYRADDKLVIESDRPKIGYEEPQSTNDGQTIWLRSSKVPLHDAKGKVIGILGIYEDITERKQAEDDRNALLFELELVNRVVLEINQASSIDVMAEILAKAVYEVNPGCHVAVSLYDEKIGGVQIKSVIGLDKNQGKIIRALGKDPRKIKFDPQKLDKVYTNYTTGKLVLVKGGLAELMAGHIPKYQCKMAEKLMGLEAVYTAGFASSEMAKGGVVVLLKKGQKIKHSAIIETLLAQSSQVIQKKQYEDQLKRNTDILREQTVSLHRSVQEVEDRNRQMRVEITERKKAEQERQALEAQLRQSQKLEAVGTMAGGIAHDFNNILQGLYLYSGIIKDQLPDDEELQSSLQQILESGERAKELVKQILTFSRKEEVELKPIRIQYLIKDALKLTRASTPSSIEITEDIDTDCGAVLGDATQIHQVFVNLCNNAVHAITSKSGSISVSLQKTQAQIETEPGKPVASKQGVLELLVRDTGKGMATETLEHIFDPFFTTKEVGEGTGLGLSIVHGIIKEMQGQIIVESQPGKGTSFRILLPVSHEKEQAAGLEEEPKQAEKHLNILFVDDDDLISGAGKLILEQNGHRVTVANNGHEALELFQKDIQAFDLVITDLTMPKMTGLELGKAVRFLSKKVLIMLTSGNLDADLMTGYESLGFNGFIRKPWSAPEMLKAISSLELH